MPTEPPMEGDCATGDIGNALQMLMLLHEEFAPGGQSVIPGSEAQTVFSTLKEVESRLRKAVLKLQRLKHEAPMWQSYYLQQQLERWL